MILSLRLVCPRRRPPGMGFSMGLSHATRPSHPLRATSPAFLQRSRVLMFDKTTSRAWAHFLPLLHPCWKPLCAAIIAMVLQAFFFSSRRRHTRFAKSLHRFTNYDSRKASAVENDVLGHRIQHRAAANGF